MLTTLDAAAAWRPYSPDDKQPWHRARAAHLFRRAGFGATWQELDAALKRSPGEVVAQLIAPDQDAVAKFDEQMQPFGESVLAGGNAEALPAWWLYRMRHSPDPLLEKLTLFWHGHFATSAAKVADVRMMLGQNELLRKRARGKFGPLVQAMSRDPAMLLYLDSATNRKTHPNENYAREVMELFCLGTGNYTEKDIQELARAFTGWEITRGRFRFNEYEHDTGTKTILAQSGKFDGDEGVEIILKQPAAARFIARKLFRFFVCDEPTPPDELIEPLAAQLRENGFEVGPVVKTMLASDLFFSEHAIGRKVRSPIELGMGLLRALEITTNMNELADKLNDLGQRPFYPPNVKGWDGGRTWINSSTLIGRANVVSDLLNGQKLEQVAARAGAKTPEELANWATELLVAVPVPDEVQKSLVKLAKGRVDPNARVGAVVRAVGALAEFQLS